MRLFVAIDLPDSVRQALRQRLGEQRRDDGFPKARWVRSERFHWTLSFLGEVVADRQAEAVLDPLAAALREAVDRHRACTLRVAGAGSFPTSGAARVLWLGVEESRPGALAALAGDLAAAVEPWAEPRRGRKGSFKPHLTVARCRPPWPRRAVERFLSGWKGFRGESFPVREVVLYESFLQPSGPRYVSRARISLREEAG
ncbi:MAG: RNA 2',3'-cyclic phosphodiesterase [Acidobacteriota bacterium]